jgi:site-specific recombinase XerD
MKISPKLFNLISEACGLDERERLDMYAGFIRLYDHFKSNRLVDSKNIYTIVATTILELEKQNLSLKTVDNINRLGFIPILLYFTLKSNTEYNAKLLDELSSVIVHYYENKRFSPPTYQYFMRALKIVKAYHKNGCLKPSDITLKTPSVLSDGFEMLISTYSENIRNFHAVSHNTAHRRCSVIRMFLVNLEQTHGVYSTNSFTHQVINEGITTYSVNYNYGGLRSALPVIRQFLRLMFEVGVTATDYSVCVPRNTPKHRKIHQGFTDDEAAKVLGGINRNTIKGKRDYAMMLIAARTGLRAVDIACLSYENIDWRTNEIRIVQRKTGNPLSLPLTAEVGNALAEYILQARPKNNSSLIFGHIYTGKTLQPQSVCAIVKKYAKISGVTTSDNRYGVHSFRRGFGKSLLESAVPIDMINELLGHTEVNSSRPYLAIDEMGLRKCALGLSLETGGAAS